MTRIFTPTPLPPLQHALVVPGWGPAMSWRRRERVVEREGRAGRSAAGRRRGRHLHTESDGNPVDEELSTATRFDKQTGRISREEAATPPAVEPTITCERYGHRAGIYVREERLSLDRRFGDHRSIAICKDE